jgi:hypothetical protein
VAAAIVISMAADEGPSEIPLAEQKTRVTRKDRGAAALLERTYAALGGAERLGRVRALSLQAGEDVIHILLPDRYQWINQTDRGKSIITLDGDRTWSVSPSWPGSAAATPATSMSDAERAKNLQRQIVRYSLIYLARLPRPDDSVSVIAAGPVTYGAVQGEAIEFRADGERDWSRLVVSSSTGQPVAFVRPLRTSPGGPAAGDAVTLLEDYREVDGVRVPFRLIEQRINQPGAADQTMRRFQYTVIRVNPALKPSDFAKPASQPAARK